MMTLVKHLERTIYAEENKNGSVCRQTQGVVWKLAGNHTNIYDSSILSHFHIVCNIYAELWASLFFLRSDNEMVRKSKYWQFIVYPESLPELWMERLEKKYPCVISPLHDKDTWDKLDEAENPEHKAGSPKKPHYHVIVEMGEGAVGVTRARKIAEMLNSKLFDTVAVPRHAFEYLTHKNAPNKFQYPEDELMILGGFKIPKEDPEAKPNWSDEAKVTEKLSTLCEDLVIVSYRELIRTILGDCTLQEYYIGTHRYGHFREYTYGIFKECQTDPEMMGAAYAEGIHKRKIPDESGTHFGVLIERKARLIYGGGSQNEDRDAFIQSAFERYEQLQKN